jgi:CDP-glucose 4,6-dehydratase
VHYDYFVRRNSLFEIYRGKKILVTGHTGFKGAWLSTWLKELGAEVTGCSLPALDGSMYSSDNFGHNVQEFFIDITDRNAIFDLIANSDEYDLVFHLAAQPIVLEAYSDPLETFEINSVGAANVVYAAINNPSCAGVVAATTDKVYKPNRSTEGHFETDPLGGLDPYSASKSAAEMLLASLRISKERDDFSIVTVRAGNVIGGGDNANNRLIPDLVRGILSSSEIVIRNPDYIRPWMHVLDVLNGYLMVGTRILHSKRVSHSYNFGPNKNDELTVLELAELVVSAWGSGKLKVLDEKSLRKKEDSVLRLNSNLAKDELSWSPNFDSKEAVYSTIDWWKSTKSFRSPLDATLDDIQKFTINVKTV